jgi:transglutaminase superfamily protein
MGGLTPQIRKHYLSFSPFTYPGLYKPELEKLPDDIRGLGLLVRKNVIHRTTLAAGNTGTNADLRFGDMTKMPWWRQPDDDVLPTAAAMLAELHRMDDRGLTTDRAVEDKIIVTCRFVSILMAAILKSKGIPARVRSGNAPYFEEGQSDDHWINQYWDDKRSRWVTIDVDGSLSINEDFDPYDMSADKFDFPAQAWLDVRTDKVKPDYFYNAGGFRGAMVVAWSLFYDFHSLMNDENIYLHLPASVRVHDFAKLTEDQLKEIDELAELMLDPDANFDKLKEIFDTKKEWRLFTGALL